MSEEILQENQLDLNKSASGTKRFLVPKTMLLWVGGIFTALVIIVMMIRGDDTGSSGPQPSTEPSKTADLGSAPPENDIKNVIRKQLDEGEKDKRDQELKSLELDRQRLFGGGVQSGQTPPVSNSQPGAGTPGRYPPIPTAVNGNQAQFDPVAADADKKDAQSRASAMLVYEDRANSLVRNLENAAGSGSGLPPELEKIADQSRKDTAQTLDMLKKNADQAARGAEQKPRDATPDRVLANDQWLAKQSNTNSPEVLKVRRTNTRYLLVQGSGIPAVLLTSLNSAQPGTVTAQVTEDIYDSVRSDSLLIPRGTRLVGTYNTDVRQGQSRIMVVFQRMIFRSGASVDLGAMNGADVGGMSGFDGEVNSQFLKTFGSALMTAIVTQAVEQRNGTPNNTTVNVYGSNGGQSLGDAAGQIVVDTAKRINDRNSQVQPFIEVERGYKFRIIVQKDMDLNPAETGVGG